MALKDIFKKKKIEQKEKKIQTEVEPQYSLDSIVLKSAHITEKAGDLVEKDKYIFKVSSEANKIKIRQEVENVFKVNVTSVRTVNIPKRKKRLGKITGWQKGYKKAIVGIKKGQKIDISPR
jgi:large subunit ribosomal protein L23